MPLDIQSIEGLFECGEFLGLADVIYPEPASVVENAPKFIYLSASLIIAKLHHTNCWNILAVLHRRLIFKWLGTSLVYKSS